MLSEDLQIYKDLTALCKQILLYLNTVPKSIRYGEYAVMLEKACEALDTVYLTNRDMAEREKRIADILILTGSVRSRIRLFGEARLLTVRQSTNLMYLLDKVAKQAMGWRNATIRNARAVKQQ